MIKNSRVSGFWAAVTFVTMLILCLFFFGYIGRDKVEAPMTLAVTVTFWFASILALLTLKNVRAEVIEWNVFVGLIFALFAVGCDWVLKEKVGFKMGFAHLKSEISTLILLVSAVATAHVLLESAIHCKEGELKKFVVAYCVIQGLLMLLAVGLAAFHSPNPLPFGRLIATMFPLSVLLLILPAVVWCVRHWKENELVCFFVPLIGVTWSAFTAVSSMDICFAVPANTSDTIAAGIKYYVQEVVGIPCAVLLAQSVVAAQARKSGKMESKTASQERGA
jgi:hypothetical protein